MEPKNAVAVLESGIKEEKKSINHQNVINMETPQEELAVSETVKNETSDAHETASKNNNGAKKGSNNDSYMADLKKRLQKEHNLKKRLEKQGADTNVIKAQVDVVNKIESQIDALKQTVLTLKDEPINIEIASDGNNKTAINKKIAFIANNRVVNYENVKKFMRIIQNGEYEPLYPIIAVKAQEALAKKMNIKAVNGEAITSDENDEYIVILDGQHKLSAFLKLNQTGGNYTVPNVHIKEGVEDIGKYLVSINKVGNWTVSNKAEIMAVLNPEDGLSEAIARRLKQGFNLSALELIYTGTRLGSNFYNKGVAGEYKIPENIGKKISIERGENFIGMSMNVAGIPMKYLQKRYFIEGFNSYAASTNDEIAFRALENLKGKHTDDDYKKVHSGEDFIKLLKGEKQE